MLEPFRQGMDNQIKVVATYVVMDFLELGMVFNRAPTVGQANIKLDWECQMKANAQIA
jgi:hypothetical protein